MSNENSPIYASLVRGMGQQDQDQTKTNLIGVRQIGPQWSGVSPDHINMVPSLIPARWRDQKTCSGPPDPGSSLVFNQAYPGSLNGYCSGMFPDFPKMGTPMPGGTDIQLPGITVPQSLNDVTQPLQGTHTKSDPTVRKRSDVPVKGEPQQPKPYIPFNEVNYKPHYGRPFSERGAPWQAEKNIPTAETPFSNLLNSNMFSQLAGKALSLASTFKGLSGQQKQKIKDSVSEDMFNIINATLDTAVDGGDDGLPLPSNRVDPETFSNNLVDLLCQCSTYSDVVSVMGRMRDDVSLQGKDKLPPIEFKSQSGFGEVGIIIDGFGEVTQNVSSEVLAAEQEFSNFVSQGTNKTTPVAKFYGQISGNTLTVTNMSFGKLEVGPDYEIFGTDVTDDTHVVRINTGNGLEGIYDLNFSSQTLSNVTMVMVKNEVREQPASGGGGGGGGGGLVGTIPGQNFFGEASKLIGEIVPVLDPKGSKKIQQLLQKIGSDKNRIAGTVANFQEQINSFRKFVG